MQINTSRCDHLEVVSHNFSFPSFCVILLCCAALSVSFGNWRRELGSGCWVPTAGMGWSHPMCLEGFSLQTQLLRRKQTKEGSGFLVGDQRDAEPVVGAGFSTLQSSAVDLLSFAFCGGVC